VRRGHSCRLSSRHHIFIFLLTCAVAQSKRVLAWMKQPPIGIWVTDAYDSLHLYSCTHVHNMNLTDTIDTNCHRSYSSYCNEYLFDTLHANNGSTCTSWAPTEHTLIKSQSQQRISHIPVNLQSTCTQFAINLLICNSILLAINLHTICNQLALCNTTTWSGIQIACNLQSTCSLQHYNFN